MSATTLTIDCGGTGLKAGVLDQSGAQIGPRIRIDTPYPLAPERFVAELAGLAERLPRADRATVGMPGMVRRGVVLATPHYVTEAGPFTPVRRDLHAAWAGFDARSALEAALGIPVRVLNDAEVAGAAVITGRGFELVLTLGTGLGCAVFDEGRLLPKIELSQHPFRHGETYDQHLGDHSLKEIGVGRWRERVRRAVRTLRPVWWWDQLYLGGGNTRLLHVDDFAEPEMGAVTLVDNAAGVLGGVRVWHWDV